MNEIDGKKKKINHFNMLILKNVNNKTGCYWQEGLAEVFNVQQVWKFTLAPRANIELPRGLLLLN